MGSLGGILITPVGRLHSVQWMDQMSNLQILFSESLQLQVCEGKGNLQPQSDQNWPILPLQQLPGGVAFLCESIWKLCLYLRLAC